MAPVTLIRVSLITREPLHLRRKVWVWTLTPQSLWKTHRKQQAWGCGSQLPSLHSQTRLLPGSSPRPTPGPPPSVAPLRVLPGTDSPRRSQNRRLETGRCPWACFPRAGGGSREEKSRDRGRSGIIFLISCGNMHMTWNSPSSPRLACTLQWH